MLFDETQCLHQSDTALLAAVYLVELLEPVLHFLFDVGVFSLSASYHKIIQ